MAFEFKFDTNKCTGCHACAIACIIENEVEIENSWRQVITYNSYHEPAQPTFHLSLACNHCEQAPCLKYCPANAYTQDAITGSVKLNQDDCIGCKYCTWVCPFDAPKFNKNHGTVEKCTFCNHRLSESKEPACVALCPTTALTMVERTTKQQRRDQINGFRDYGISPGITIVGLDDSHRIPEMDVTTSVSFDILTLLKKQIIEPAPKIRLRNEWTLLLLSILFPLLITVTANILLHDFGQDFVPFILCSGVLSLGISMLHLGKIKKAYRAILNLKNSWLSREVFFLSAFLFLLTLGYVYGNLEQIKVFVLGAGILALVSMDKVYQVIPRINYRSIESSSVLLSGLYWYGILSINFWLVSVIGSLRLFLYLRNDHNQFNLPLIRVLCGYFFPVLLILSGNAGHIFLVVSLILAGEIIDRFEFFHRLDIITPLRQMKIDEESNLYSTVVTAADPTETDRQ